MNNPIVYVPLFILFAIFYPMVIGKKWPKSFTAGYRLGMCGAAIVLATISFLSWLVPG